MALKIKGTQYQKELASLGHHKNVTVSLVPEFDNPYDPSAVAVYIRDMKVGYLPAGTLDPDSEYGPRVARIIREKEGKMWGQTSGGFRDRNGSQQSYGLDIFPFGKMSAK